MMDPKQVTTETEPDVMAVLLDKVHVALLEADYGQLALLTEQTEAELVRLESSRDSAALSQIREKALRNETCLLAAQRGFRAARHRMKEISAALSGLVTYDTKGRRAEQHPTNELERRF